MGPYQSQSHYNLGLVYERRGMLQEAQQEILLSLKLDPNQDDARNELGVIYAEEGDDEHAHQEWARVSASNPSYTPSRANLAILKRVERGEIKGPQRLSGFALAR
jgi:Flp pilus assembly protein TadD